MGTFNTILYVGVDLAKNVFAIQAVDENRKAALFRLVVPRSRLDRLVAAPFPMNGKRGATTRPPAMRSGIGMLSPMDAITNGRCDRASCKADGRPADCLAVQRSVMAAGSWPSSTARRTAVADC